jgi:hypothetical protein
MHRSIFRRLLDPIGLAAMVVLFAYIVFGPPRLGRYIVSPTGKPPSLSRRALIWWVYLLRLNPAGPGSTPDCADLFTLRDSFNSYAFAAWAEGLRFS